MAENNKKITTINREGKTTLTTVLILSVILDVVLFLPGIFGWYSILVAILSLLFLMLLINFLIRKFSAVCQFFYIFLVRQLVAEISENKVDLIYCVLIIEFTGFYSQSKGAVNKLIEYTLYFVRIHTLFCIHHTFYSI